MTHLPCTLYAGQRGSLPPDGEASGIFKQPVGYPVTIGPLGIIGDVQADRRYHGGPEQALHLYPADHYPRLARAFAMAADLLAPAVLGENLSVTSLDEHGVRVGDVFALGAVRLEVSQPRRPCWKIDARCGAPGMAAWITREGCTGWYFRVLEGGTLQAPATLELLASDPAEPTLAELLALGRAHRPPLAELARAAASRTLGADWRRRLRERLAWLERHGG